VVVWDTPFGLEDVFGQRYDSLGAPLGPEFRVNTHTPSIQRNPSAAADASGNFVVVLLSFGQDGPSDDVMGQRYAGSGTPLGPEFRVNSYTTGDQFSPEVASDTAGNFVVVWGDSGQDGSGSGVFGQRYAASGTPLGQEFRVNTFATNDQKEPSVAVDSVGNFVVTWTSHRQDDPFAFAWGVFGQRYAASGTPLGPEFRVNTFTTGNQFHAAVASDGAGDFVVAWTSNLQDGSYYGVFGQRYSQIVPVELMHFRVE
jgi:large repetitive protein